MLDAEDTTSPATGDDYVPVSGARAGQPVSSFPTELLRVISRGGARDPGGDSAAFARSVERELERRMESAAAVEPAVRPRPVASSSGVMPLPCGHPSTMLERLQGELFMSRCIGCTRLEELAVAVQALAPRAAGKVMDAVRAWERKHHTPREG